MPFTLAHPAAVLPLLRSPLSALALVAGAMAPDLPYFLVSARLPVSAQSWYEPFMNSTTTHSVAGAVSVDLLIGATLCAVLLVAAAPAASVIPALEAVPRGARRWLGRPGLRPRLARLGWIVLSLLIGTATHLLWDACTHGELADRAGLLGPGGPGGLSWGRGVQYLSTAAGLVAVAWFLWRRRDRARAVAGPAAFRVRHGWAWALVTGAGAVLNTSAWWDGGPAYLTSSDVLEGVLADLAKGAMLALATAGALYVAGWWIRHAAAAAG